MKLNKKNSVFIATSLDGFIADKNGEINWLYSIPNPNMDDMGYTDFVNKIDALVMGRTTFETVLGFDVDWPYDKPVFVWSSKLDEIPKSHIDKAYLVRGTSTEIVTQIHKKGYHRLYIDGGATIRSFLASDLIDEIILSTIPILLGGGSPLFTELPNQQKFQLLETKTYLNQITQSHYVRKR